jgi:hypothetical protein
VRSSAAIKPTTSARSFFKHLARISALCSPTVTEISAPTLSRACAMAYLSWAVVPRSSSSPVRVGIAALSVPENASPAGSQPWMTTTSFTSVRYVITSMPVVCERWACSAIPA